MQSLDFDTLFYIYTRLDISTLAQLLLMPESGYLVYSFVQQPIFWKERIKTLLDVEDIPYTLNLAELKQTYYIIEKALGSKYVVYTAVKLRNEVAVHLLLKAGYDPSVYELDNTHCAFCLAYSRYYNPQLYDYVTISDELIFKLLLNHYRTDLFTSESIVDAPVLNSFLRKVVQDSLSGLIVGYYFSVPPGEHIYYPLRYDTYMTAANYFFYVFLLSVVHTRLPIKQRIDKLKEMLIVHDMEHIIDKSIKTQKPDIQGEEDLHNVLEGFLILYTNPNLTFLEIMDKIRLSGYSNNSIVMTGKLIGSHLGLKMLISQGLTVTADLQEGYIDKILAHPLTEIVNQAI